MATHTIPYLSQPQFRSLELFSGAGGLALGTHLAGFKHVALVERDPKACATLTYNINNHQTLFDKSMNLNHWKVVQEDVQNLDFRKFGPVDLIAGGPPCQPFSIGGKHNGVNDDRDMIPHFARAVGELRPRAFIMENVKGLLRSTFDTYFQLVLMRLKYPSLPALPKESWQDHHARLSAHQQSGAVPEYHVHYRLLNSANHGVAQTRERVFIVGFRSDLIDDWRFEDPSHGMDSLLYDQWVSGDYWKRHNTTPVDEPPKRFRTRIARLGNDRRPAQKPWQTVRDALQGLPDPRESHNLFTNHHYQPGARVYKGHSGSHLDWPSKTLKSGVHGVPGGENMIAYPDGSVRYFSAREAARIQTFPDGWIFQGAWTVTMRQLGNAVPVDLATMVALGVANKLRSSDEHLQGIQSA